MTQLGSTSPDSDPALERLMVESRVQLRAPMRGRERAVETVAATLFLICAGAMSIGLDATRALDPGLAITLIALYALATRVEFQMGSGFTNPSQLVFVPMLFLLPTPSVPLFVAAARLVSRLPEYLSRTVHFDRALLRIADASYAIWPALVLVLAGTTTPDWGDWPIYVGALAAQFAFDLVTITARVSIGLAASPRTVAMELRAVYLVDALLAPIGLLAAFAATSEPAAVLLLLPLIALFVVFSRERQARIESALTLSSAYRGTALLLGEVLSNTSEYTGSHSRSVVVLAHQVGKALDVGETALRDIEFGALLHDVGKMAVPPEILNKPASLTDEEMAIVQKHTLEGEDMLSRIGGVLGDVGSVVRSHHERFDGKGYPDGLEGEQIPLPSRVIACCDAFNAMTTDRVYRAAMPVEAAVAELRSEAGAQFDPKVVEALVGIVESWDADQMGEISDPASQDGGALSTARAGG